MKKMDLNNLYKKYVYNDSLVGMFINPFYISRSAIYCGIKKMASNLQGGDLLDVGCGAKPYETLFKVDSYTGIDVQVSGHDHSNSRVDKFFDGMNIPYEDKFFDHVLCTEVLEHAFELDLLLSEINRVLKEEGKFYITIPFCWNEHEQPYDFARYSQFGIKYLLNRHGFEIESLKKSTTFVEAITQIFTAYLYLCILPKNRYVRTLLVPILIAPVNIFGMLLAKILPDDETLPLNLIIAATKKSE